MTRVGPAHEAFLFSPGNWAVSSDAARSMNPGAYFRIAFEGSACTLRFDTSANSADMPELYHAIDGAPRIRARAAPRVVLDVPPETRGWPRHLLEVCFKSMSRGAPRFPACETMLTFAGLEVEDGAGVHRPIERSNSVLVMGDSITEGLLAGQVGPAPPQDQDDALRAYAFQLGDHLGMEVGVVGFSGQGLTIAGDGGIPPFPEFYRTIVPGTVRTFRPEPTLIVLNLGTNDGVKTTETSRVTQVLATVLHDFLRRTERTRIVVLQPFGKYLTRELRAAVHQMGDARCVFLPTHVAPDDLVDGYHPGGSASLLHIAPRLANDLRDILADGDAIARRRTRRFLPRFRR